MLAALTLVTILTSDPACVNDTLSTPNDFYFLEHLGDLPAHTPLCSELLNYVDCFHYYQIYGIINVYEACCVCGGGKNYTCDTCLVGYGSCINTYDYCNDYDDQGTCPPDDFKQRCTPPGGNASESDEQNVTSTNAPNTYESPSPNKNEECTNSAWGFYNPNGFFLIMVCP